MLKTRVRLKGQRAHYHCLSRIVAGERLLGEAEREVFGRMLDRVAGFCGVRVLTFAVLSNHFHLLVEVPAPRRLSDAELMRRYRLLYGGEVGSSWHLPADRLEALLAEDGPAAERWRSRLHRRMHDVSEFMRTLKQRFALWFNRSHNRFGTLWAECFKSLLVEPSVLALRTVAAYIDLNPVRAGMAEDPADFKGCGLGAANAGSERARAGLAEILGERPSSWPRLLRRYRELLGAPTAAEKPLPHAPGEGKTEPAEERRPLQFAEAIRRRVRYFSEGGVLGSPEFVRECLRTASSGGASATGTDAKAMAGTDWGGLAVARTMRRSVFGA